MLKRLATVYLLPDTLKVFWTSYSGQRKYKYSVCATVQRALVSALLGLSLQHTMLRAAGEEFFECLAWLGGLMQLLGGLQWSSLFSCAHMARLPTLLLPPSQAPSSQLMRAPLIVQDCLVLVGVVLLIPVACLEYCNAGTAGVNNLRAQPRQKKLNVSFCLVGSPGARLASTLAIHWIFIPVYSIYFINKRQCTVLYSKMS